MPDDKWRDLACGNVLPDFGGVIGPHGRIPAKESKRPFAAIMSSPMWKKLLLALLAVVVISVGMIGISYLNWRSDRLEAIHAGSRSVDTRLGTIAFTLTGSSGPVILFLHGIPGGYDQAPAWQRDGFRLLAPSRPGYLGTPIEVGRTPAEQADAYLALLDELGIEEVVLMGASGGGPSAIAFSAMFPDRSSGLILLEAMSQSFPNDGTIMPLMRSDFLYWSMMKAMLKTGGAEALVASQVPDEENQRRILEYPERVAEFERVIWSIWPPSERLDGWENDMAQLNELTLPVSEVRVPVLIIHGTADTQVPFEQSAALADSVVGAELYRVDGADHMMPITHRAEIDAVIQRFLNSLGG